MKEVPETSFSSLFSLGITLLFVWLVFFYALVQGALPLAVPAAGVLILMHGGRIWSRVGLARLRLQPEMDRDRLFPGETFRFRAVVENRKPLPVWVQIELRASRDVLAGEDILRGETALRPYGRARRSWNLAVLRRGVFTIGPARISAGDLLGLHRRTRSVPFSREIIVFPRMPRLRPLDLPFQEFFGLHASKGAVEDPAWYAGTRDYLGNRPAKNIHWKASARLGILQEKIFEPTSHRKVIFVLDRGGFAEDPPYAVPSYQRPFATEPEALSDAARPDGASASTSPAGPSSRDWELLIEVLASSAREVMESGSSFGFLTNAALTGGRTPHLPLGRGPEHLGVLLEMLARVEGRFGEALEPLIRYAAQGGTGLIYFGASGEGSEDRMATAQGAGPRMLFVLAPGSGIEPPAAEGGTAGRGMGESTPEESSREETSRELPLYGPGGRRIYLAEDLLDD